MDFDIENVEELQRQLELLQSNKEDIHLREVMEETNRELQQVQREYTRNYLKRLPEILTLSDEIQEMDSMLEKMESELKEYHGAISSMNAEIANLHSTSSLLTTKLKNRLQAHQLLINDLEGIVVSSDLVKYPSINKENLRRRSQ
jgi:DNA repair exonuclease SbcCD ATPase subunit